ncbi:MAG: flavodoxin domain-containing protein [Oscillospiraceae bacterium]|nr:flavodoxin domain-containing protein [Oscillospiraceae bacterium]
MKAIIYESNTGSAKRYAEMLSEKLGVPAYSLKEAQKALPKDEEAVFLGWVFANKIQGFSKAQKRWNLVCACAVGINPRTDKYIEILKESNPTDIPIFYLRGKLDLKKLKWLQRKLLETIRADLEKQNKPGTEEMISILKNGCDLVSEDMLKETIAYLLMNM